MLDPLPLNHPLRRLFTGTVQHVLYSDMGLCDPELADYLGELLSSFVHTDQIYPFRDAEGQRLEDMARVLAEAQLETPSSEEARQRILHRHIGDFTLFWTGLYPEGLGRLRRSPAPGRLTDFVETGKRSYSIASELTHEDEEPPASVLRRLSDRFEYCVYGLNRCRREWEILGKRPFDG